MPHSSYQRNQSTTAKWIGILIGVAPEWGGSLAFTAVYGVVGKRLYGSTGQAAFGTVTLLGAFLCVLPELITILPFVQGWLIGLPLME